MRGLHKASICTLAALYLTNTHASTKFVSLSSHHLLFRYPPFVIEVFWFLIEDLVEQLDPAVGCSSLCPFSCCAEHTLISKVESGTLILEEDVHWKAYLHSVHLYPPGSKSAEWWQQELAALGILTVVCNNAEENTSTTPWNICTTPSNLLFAPRLKTFAPHLQTFWSQVRKQLHKTKAEAEAKEEQLVLEKEQVRMIEDQQGMFCGALWSFRTAENMKVHPDSWPKLGTVLYTPDRVCMVCVVCVCTCLWLVFVCICICVWLCVCICVWLCVCMLCVCVKACVHMYQGTSGGLNNLRFSLTPKILLCGTPSSGFPKVKSVAAHSFTKCAGK